MNPLDDAKASVQPPTSLRSLLSRLAPGVSREDVEWAYRTILRRTPESTDVITQHLRKRGLRELVAEFLMSPEYVKVAVTLNSQTLLQAGTYISLGTHCFSSSLLRRLGVRSWSGPFDWTFTSLPMVTHCIADDFAAFLDRSQYEPVPETERPNGPTVNRVQHRFYRSQFGVQYVFNHHDVHLQDGYDYIVRCVERFRAALKSDGPKVFLATSWSSNGAVEQLKEMHARLSERTEGFRIVAVVVENERSDAIPSARKLCDETGLVVWSYTPVSTWGAVSFEDSVDESSLARILALECKVPARDPAASGDVRYPS